MKAAFGLLALLAIPSIARAEDRVPSSVDCPEGSEPASVHGAAECYPTECADDSGCKSGFVCQERGLCVQTRMTGGLASSARVAVGSCGGASTCKYPAECLTAKRCVKEGSGSKLKRACGCTTIGAPGGSESIAIAAAACALAFARRRRR